MTDVAIDGSVPLGRALSVMMGRGQQRTTPTGTTPTGTQPTGTVPTEAGSLRWQKRCLRRAKKGDTAAVGELYDAFAGRLYSRILLPRLGEPMAAEDALAETFKTALERLDRFDFRGISIWNWLSRIAVNKATDMHRARARTRRSLSRFEDLLEPIWPESEPPSSPSETRERTEQLKRAISATLAEINPRYRRAIELRFFEDRDRQQCAEIMEVKLGTFDVLMLRSLRAFRNKWVAAYGSQLEES